MESSQLFNIFQSYLEQLPSFLALIAGIVFAMTRWKHHPRVAMVVVIALGFLLFHMIVFTIVYNVVPRWVIRSSGSYEDFRTVIDRVYLILGLISNGAAAIAFGGLLAAIFMRRRSEPVAETNL
ncbi:MAG TPA: hypothetical protein VIT19_08805 [Pyrinomonadaceae bacterium]